MRKQKRTTVTLLNCMLSGVALLSLSNIAVRSKYAVEPQLGAVSDCIASWGEIR